jgi:hypothetical protein
MVTTGPRGRRSSARSRTPADGLFGGLGSVTSSSMSKSIMISWALATSMPELIVAMTP